MSRFLLRGGATTLLAVALLGLFLPATLAAEPTDEAAWTVLEERPANGEQCLVCKKAIHDGTIVELRYKGRTFHVASAMLERFESEPELFFGSLEAHSALFDEAAKDGPQMSNGWLYFGLYVLVGLVFAALCAYFALARGKPATTWFFAGLIGNLFALAALLASPKGNLSDLPAGVPPGLAKVPTTHAPTECPSCGAPHHPAATQCPGCGHALQPTIEAETARI